jgi:catechol 2,3-dioxygenase-like lactoylglutathione lyase family enzyme
MNDGKHSLISEEQRAALDKRRRELSAKYLVASPQRPESSARGVHHIALVCGDVERTIEFYQGLLEFPLVEMFENRDLGGSTHFFFDLGIGNLLAFFDLPGVDPAAYAEVLGGLHHLAISIDPAKWKRIKAKFDAQGIAYAHMDGSSLYFNDPDGARLELICDPLREMYGQPVG